LKIAANASTTIPTGGYKAKGVLSNASDLPNVTEPQPQTIYHCPKSAGLKERRAMRLPRAGKHRSFLILFISVYWFLHSCFRKLKVAFFFIKENCAAILNTPKINTREKLGCPRGKERIIALLVPAPSLKPCLGFPI
jgi:hypothetical protein